MHLIYTHINVCVCVCVSLCVCISMHDVFETNVKSMRENRKFMKKAFRQEPLLSLASSD